MNAPVMARAERDKFAFPGFHPIKEPSLRFHPERKLDQDIHPLRGLANIGPYSSPLNVVPDPIRAAIVAPINDLDTVDQLLVELEHTSKPSERVTYLPDFLGFSRIFRTRVVSADETCRIGLDERVEAEVLDSGRPHLALAERLLQAISALTSHRNDFDVLLIYLPERWKAAFYGNEDFDLHDYLKAATAQRAVPMQVLREQNAISYPARCSVMWHLGIALYAKAGGVPWKLAIDEPDVAYVGISYALRSTASGDRRYVTCCSQVFDADGSGLQFLVYDTDDIRIEHDNPFMSRSEMRRVVARSLSLYQLRHAGRVPNRLVIHKSTEFKRDEIDGCFDAWGRSQDLDLIQVQEDVAWRGIKLDPPRGGTKDANPAAFPIERGVYVQLGPRETLLWTQGNVPGIARDGRNYYKESRGIPSPLLLRRFGGHGGWEDSCQRVIGLTKMNWNNDVLYDRLPVTMSYAKVLARTVKRMSNLASHPYEFRFFM